MAVDLWNKKILVTGGAGFVGRHLIKNLTEKRGVPISSILIPRSSEFDLRIKTQAERVVYGSDIVFHLAALSGGIGFSIKHPGRMFYDNAIMGLNIIEASRAAGVEKIIHTGSYNEYPEGAPMPLKEEYLWSGLPDKSFLPYGMAKRMILAQMQTYRVESGFNGVHLIMPSMFGPDYEPNSTNLIPTFIRQIIKAKTEGLPMIGWGTGAATRDLLYIEDAVEGIILAAERYNEPEPLNIGSGREVSIKFILTTLCDLMNFTGDIHWDSSKPEGQARYILDITRAQKELGFEPITDLKDGLAKTIIAS